MRKFLLFLLILSVFLLPTVSTAEISSQGVNTAEIEDTLNSIAHYAEEYEVGNINYLQLNVYGYKIRSDLNLLLGGGIGENWGRIPKESVETALGPPTDYSNWLWVDNKHLNKRFDEAMPWWEKIVFDGRKVRIVFHAFPSAIEGENGELFKYYSVDLNVNFKKKFDFSFDAILGEITSLAADYNLTRTAKSGEVLVKKMLEAQKIFGGYIQENLERCTETLEGFFKPEEKWPKQKMMTWNFPLYTGSDFDVMVRTDMCEECEWHHLNLMLDVEGRGPMNIFKSPELQSGKLEQQIDEEYYRTLSIDEINLELKKTVFEIKDDAEKFDKTRSEDFPKKFFFNKFKVQQINRILDGKYNEVQELDGSIAKRIESGELQGPGGCKTIGECRHYCGKRDNQGECRKFTYGLRVDFLEKMFSGYLIERTPLDQMKWEKRLFENLETRQDSWCRHVNDLQCREDEGCVGGTCVPALGGNETCDNGKDDDGDGVMDCQDPDCRQERRCGKLCEPICNKDGGCWQTSHELCSGVCKTCWDCGGDEEKCKSICEPECWPCNNQKAVMDACDDCWACEDGAYGGCHVKCKPCTECNAKRTEMIKAIFARAAAGEIKLPGDCMTEEACNEYCAQHGGECGGIMNEVGFYSEELDCNGECKECTICNHDLGNFNCNNNQRFDRDNGFCVCGDGWYDCDGNWKNGCEVKVPCNAGPCFEECKECDANCKEGENCTDLCLECHKCRNPDMPTYVCDGVEQSEPCEPVHICNGVRQKKPCEIYLCNGREYLKPCDEINVTCGKNQIPAESGCVCREGFRDCDNDGNCESTQSCGFEICDDGKDNNNDALVDCQDAKCNRRVCGIEDGEELLCINRMCISPDDESVPPEPEPACGDHKCGKNESVASCPEDCVVCAAYEPPECPTGKIIWKGKDSLGCLLPPVCVVTGTACESDADCPQPRCGVSQCIAGECKVKELITECEEGCKEGKTKNRQCKDGSEIVTAICSANEWLKTGYDCIEVPLAVSPTLTPSETHVVSPILTQPEVPPTPSEEIAPEVETATRAARGECAVANDCGGPQDVCSNGNCVTLPIPVETEIPAENPPAGQQPQAPPESASPSEPQSPPSQEAPSGGDAPTGSMTAGFVTGRFASVFAVETQPCKAECRPCEECNQKIDTFMKRIMSGEISGPNGCKNRMACTEYCQREEHKEECGDFLRTHGLETFDCWQQFCRECDKCKFRIGELECKANQRFDMEEGFCKCNDGWYDCDGDWENGCESSQGCWSCQSKGDCAKDRCAPWGNVVQQFDCFKGEAWVQEKGVVRLEGSCRVFPTKKIEGGVGFDMWGEPFEELHPIREQAEREMGMGGCEWELENNLKERMEIQKSFTRESLQWFFEEYVPSSPSEWEKHIGGIYDSYWRIVNNNERTAENLLCLGRDKLPEEYKPIDVSYDTDFGSVRIWEVKTTTDFFGKRMNILSPYMRIWVFPTKEFMKQQFQDAMTEGVMPGPDGKKNPELSPLEVEELKKDKRAMDMINSISNKYGGEAKFLFSVVDGNESVFNTLFTINPEIMVKSEPMESYGGEYDVKLTFDFDFFYSLVRTTEKEMRGGQTMYPPWEQGGLKIGDKIKGAVDGMKMLFKMMSGAASGSIRSDPAASLPDGLAVMYFAFAGGPS